MTVLQHRRDTTANRLAVIPAAAEFFYDATMERWFGGDSSTAGGNQVDGIFSNSQTGTSYTVQATDVGHIITLDNASPVAVTLGQAASSSGTYFPANSHCKILNLGAGDVTITPATSTINGYSSLILAQGQGCILISNGINYFAIVSGFGTPNSIIITGTVEDYTIGNGNWWTTAVPYFRQNVTGGIALDIMPNGAAATCWIDICSTDIIASHTNYEILHLAKYASSYASVSADAAGTGTIRNLALQEFGGNVGIGLTNPPDTLDVYANNFESTINAIGDGVPCSLLATHYQNSASGSLLQLQKARGSYASPTAVNSGDTIGNISNNAWDGSAFQDLVAVKVFVDTFTGANNLSGYITLSTRPDGSGASLTERLRITKVGSVGIGTTTPGSTLEVNGLITADAGIQFNGSASGFPAGSIGYSSSEFTSCSDTWLFNNGANTQTNATINTSGISTGFGVLSTGTAGVGYATGAGGTVTQSTSKTTGVTLNKTTGEITMNNAALANNVAAVFTLTNSTIAAADIIVLNIISGSATVGSYIPYVGAVAAGSCQICVLNRSGGSLSEAVVIGFAVVKGATS